MSPTVSGGLVHNNQSRPPILAVFLDGLGADAIARMPFLSAQTSVRRLRTELGYSITCHASMYTGVRPDRHHLWFVWMRDPVGSPFRWLRRARWAERIDHVGVRVLATKIARRFTRTSSWFGVPYPVHVPWRHLPELNVSERRLWSDPGYLDSAPTVFDYWRNAGVSFEIVGMAKGRAAGLHAIEAWEPPDQPAAVTYLFAGDIDHASHAYGQKSDEVTALLSRVDDVIRKRVRQMEGRSGKVDLVVWSDHGHHDVEKLDPFALLERHGISLEPHLYVIDTNFIRVWVDDAAAREALVTALDSMDVGHVLTSAELERYRLRMPDNRYGDVIFYLELPYAFTRTIWGYGRRLASAHGYLPDHVGSDGVFVSSLPVADGPVELVDVGASLLALTGAPPSIELDGRQVWRG